jgi:hypothetical protein
MITKEMNEEKNIMLRLRESIARIDAELASLAELKEFVAFMQTYSQENPLVPEEAEAEQVRK